MKNYKDLLIENSMATKKPIDDIGMLRSAIIAEYDAVNMYEAFAKKCINEKARKVFLDVANEEKQHIGEFEALAEKLDPHFVKMKKEGRKETEE